MVVLPLQHPLEDLLPCGGWFEFDTGVCEKTVLLREPWPRDPEEKTALQHLNRCSETSSFSHVLFSGGMFASQTPVFGWHYLSDATCLMRPHAFSAALFVFLARSGIVRRNFAGISPEFTGIHWNFVGIHQIFARTSNWSALKKGMTTTRPSDRVM